jgi:hypothetical protein
MTVSGPKWTYLQGVETRGHGIPTRYILNTEGTSALIEAVRLMERLNEISRANGITEGRVMTQSFGPFNQIAVDVDYPDLATYERKTEAYFSLLQVQEVIRKLEPSRRRCIRAERRCGRT